jgi:hypothetical protein
MARNAHPMTDQERIVRFIGLVVFIAAVIALVFVAMAVNNAVVGG